MKKPLLTYDAVKDKALRLLEFRSHSERELADKLRRAGAAREHIDAALDFCREYGFLNDERYAVSKAADLFRLKRLGTRRIREELKMLGIAEEYIDAAVAELDPAEERETLARLAERKLNGDFSDKNKNKCIRFLVYRGYELRDILDAVCTLEETDDV